LEQRIDETLYETAKSQTLAALFKEGAENDLVITKNTSSATDSTGFSVAKVNSEGKIEKSYRDDALISSQKDLQSYIDKIYTNGQESGFIGSYRYLKAETKTGNVILFLNCQRDLESYYSFVRNTVIISSIVILSVLIIIVMVSKKVIAPIQQSYVKQKQFITDASHELKTPLTRLQLSTALVRHQTGDIEPVKRIEKEIQRMDKMISELLLISRQQMHSQMEHNLFSIDQLWDDVIKDALFEAEQRKITCDVNISILHPEKHMIYGNLSLLTSAIENIVRNALKYTKDRIFLTINLQKNEQDENCLQIRVDDNGLGLPPEEFDKIFKPFYRVDETRTRATGGTGLGLTIVYNVVNEHHGKVWAESSNLGGLAVTIQLPLWKQS